MSFLMPEVVLLIGILFVLVDVRKNFFIPAAGMAYAGWFGLTQITFSLGNGFYLLSAMVILVICACGYSFLLSFEKQG